MPSPIARSRRERCKRSPRHVFLRIDPQAHCLEGELLSVDLLGPAETVREQVKCLAPVHRLASDQPLAHRAQDRLRVLRGRRDPAAAQQDDQQNETSVHAVSSPGPNAPRRQRRAACMTSDVPTAFFRPLGGNNTLRCPAANTGRRRLMAVRNAAETPLRDPLVRLRRCRRVPAAHTVHSSSSSVASFQEIRMCERRHRASCAPRGTSSSRTGHHATWIMTVRGIAERSALEDGAKFRQRETSALIRVCVRCAGNG